MDRFGIASDNVSSFESNLFDAVAAFSPVAATIAVTGVGGWSIEVAFLLLVTVWVGSTIAFSSCTAAVSVIARWTILIFITALRPSLARPETIVAAYTLESFGSRCDDNATSTVIAAVTIFEGILLQTRASFFFVHFSTFFLGSGPEAVCSAVPSSLHAGAVREPVSRTRFILAAREGDAIACPGAKIAAFAFKAEGGWLVNGAPSRLVATVA